MELKSPKDYVTTFIASANEVAGLFCTQLEGVKSFSDVVRLARRGEIPRKGSLGRGYKYEVHGAGCLIVDSDHRVIDIDFMVGGAEGFNVWRLRHFIESVGSGDFVSDVELTEVCRGLVADGVLFELREGWFGLVR